MLKLIAAICILGVVSANPFFKAMKQFEEDHLRLPPGILDCKADLKQLQREGGIKMFTAKAGYLNMCTMLKEGRNATDAKKHFDAFLEKAECKKPSQEQLGKLEAIGKVFHGKFCKGCKAQVGQSVINCVKKGMEYVKKTFNISSHEEMKKHFIDNFSVDKCREGLRWFDGCITEGAKGKNGCDECGLKLAKMEFHAMFAVSALKSGIPIHALLRPCEAIQRAIDGPKPEHHGKEGHHGKDGEKEE